MHTRVLGTVCIVGTLAILVDGFRTTGASAGQYGDSFTSLAYALWGIGGICGLAGLIKLNALGTKAMARALGFIPMIGFAAFVLGDGLRTAGLLTADAPVYLGITAIGWLTMLTGMLVVGILTIAAKSWRGWRRFVPLLTMVMLPIALGIGALSGNQALVVACFSVGWVLLGIIVATAEAPSPLRQAPA